MKKHGIAETKLLVGYKHEQIVNYFNDGSALFIAVYAADEKGILKESDAHFVGFSYGFVGVRDKKIGFRDPDNLIFYSQYTGVKKTVEDYGLGILIKEFQKKML